MAEWTDTASVQRGRTVNSVRNAVQILRMLCAGPEPRGISEIARELGLNKATVHSLLHTLRSEGLVKQDGVTRKYGPGWGLLELGSSVMTSHQALSEVAQALPGLARRTGETAFLAVLDQGAVLFVHSAQSPLPIRLVTKQGKREPVHATATGKVLLAWESDEVVQELLGRRLDRYTANTVVDTQQLVEELYQVRQRRYSTCWEEHQEGVCGLGVPLFLNATEPIGALGVAGPANRLNPENFLPALEELQNTAAEVTRTLSGQRFHG